MIDCLVVQAGEEPVVLPVGTEVSAKYRGAFCEAKVKKIVKCVKCKVSVACVDIEHIPPSKWE